MKNVREVILVAIICIVVFFVSLKINCQLSEFSQDSLAENEDKEDKNINQVESLEPGDGILCKYWTEFGDENYRYIATIFEI